MRRGFAIACVALGCMLLAAGLFSLLSLALVTYAVAPLLAGGAFLSAGMLSLRGPSPPITTPLHRAPNTHPALPHEGQAPAIEIRGGAYASWNWSPENPLGGSVAWNLHRNPASWDWERHTRHDLRYQVRPDVDERWLRVAADRACKRARKALDRRGGVRAHGELRGDQLTLHLDVHSMSVPDDNREAAVRAFDDAFRKELTRL